MVRARPLLASLGLAITLVAMPVSASAATSADALAEAQIRSALARGSDAPSILSRDIVPGDVSAIVRNRIDRRLSLSATGFAGRDFAIAVPEDGSRRQIGTLSVRYPSAKVARQRIALVKPVGGYFRQSKILTRFSAARRGDEIVIVYTESAGDDRMVALTRSIAASAAAD
jgi:hypothetical protein